MTRITRGESLGIEGERAVSTVDADASRARGYLDWSSSLMPPSDAMMPLAS
jgi:hypothetical protein